MACRETLIAYLWSNHVPFTVQAHRPTFTAREVAATAHLPALMIAKVVVVIADERPAMLVLPASHRVSLRHVRDLLEARHVRLAEERELATLFPDCSVGATPPFGNLYGVQVYVDSMIAAQPKLVFQAGSHTETMTVSYADFARLVRPWVANVAGELREQRAPA